MRITRLLLPANVLRSADSAAGARWLHAAVRKRRRAELSPPSDALTRPTRSRAHHTP